MFCVHELQFKKIDNIKEKNIKTQTKESFHKYVTKPSNKEELLF